MKEIYMNSINGDIIMNMEDYDIIDKVREDDNKLKPSLKLGNVQDYLKKYKEVKELFEKQNKEIEIGNTKKPSEELISIDNIENIYVQFIKVPICVFVSNNGVDIDILLQIPLHRITDSASNGSVFPVVTEHFSASSDHAFL